MVGTCTARDLVPASVCRGRALCRARAACGYAAPPRIAARSEATCPRVATALRAGTASLYINPGRYVHSILCPRPCVAAEPRRRVSRQSRASACRGEAALRLIDPRKLYSIIRPGSINRLIVNNPNLLPQYHPHGKVSTHHKKMCGVIIQYS